MIGTIQVGLCAIQKYIEASAVYLLTKKNIGRLLLNDKKILGKLVHEDAASAPPVTASATGDFSLFQSEKFNVF